MIRDFEESIIPEKINRQLWLAYNVGQEISMICENIKANVENYVKLGKEIPVDMEDDFEFILSKFWLGHTKLMTYDFELQSHIDDCFARNGKETGDETSQPR